MGSRIPDSLVFYESTPQVSPQITLSDYSLLSSVKHHIPVQKAFSIRFARPVSAALPPQALSGPAGSV